MNTSPTSPSPSETPYEQPMPNPVLDEVSRLIAFYKSDESNQDEHTSLRLLSLEVRPCTADENPIPANAPLYQDCYWIGCESVEISGPVGERLSHHDNIEIVTESGKLLSHFADGVEQVTRSWVDTLRDQS